ncbi:MAG: hypothetical protein Kow0074_16600 [Candidatus Zixiibacteriota bacterium]
METSFLDFDFDWHAERTSQSRDVSRFGSELDRALSLRSRTPSVRAAAERAHDQFERLKRRLDSRAVRFGDQWDRLVETAETLRRERDRLLALADLDERIAGGAEIEEILDETLHCVNRSFPCDGALIVLHDVEGRSYRHATERRRGRPWPVAADRELAGWLVNGVRGGRPILLEGRPVGTGPRERSRAAHWMAVPVGHKSEHYGAIVAGRTATETSFLDDEADALRAMAHRLGRALAARVGVSARPVPGAGPKPEGFEHLWGESPAFKRALALAANYAASDSPVVLEGEPGTGRESVARAIHARSPRRGQPFVVARISDLPEDVVSRTLFGTMTRSSDGTVVDRPGDLELADGGTLFIDSIAALGPVHQVRLLQFLQDGVFERDGDRTRRAADVRLMFSTDVDLDRLYSDGRLRQELYYLIAVARVWMPPLRERGTDVIELARRFAQEAARRHGKQVDGIDVAAAGVLSAARLQGNVRQLSQVIERAVLIAEGPLISPYDLPDLETDTPAPPRTETAEWTDRAVSAMRMALAAGTAGDYPALKRAKREIIAALHGAFVDGVTATVGASPSRAARHCQLHRIQWQRLRATAIGDTGGDAEDRLRHSDK